MRENNKNILRGSEAAFAVAALLLNFLILAVVIGALWSLQLLISPNISSGAALGETIWR
ncbi:MAG TPA: hypothetical protein VF599_14200 [Pyrinomonadaceae bacterium]|jgi:hypothetical protein